MQQLQQLQQLRIEALEAAAANTLRAAAPKPIDRHTALNHSVAMPR